LRTVIAVWPFLKYPKALFGELNVNVDNNLVTLLTPYPGCSYSPVLGV
jgi:hypothetical protein